VQCDEPDPRYGVSQRTAEDVNRLIIGGMVQHAETLSPDQRVGVQKSSCLHCLYGHLTLEWLPATPFRSESVDMAGVSIEICRHGTLVIR
jgi:hypothetical protein